MLSVKCNSIRFDSFRYCQLRLLTFASIFMKTPKKTPLYSVSYYSLWCTVWSISWRSHWFNQTPIDSKNIMVPPMEGPHVQQNEISENSFRAQIKHSEWNRSDCFSKCNFFFPQLKINHYFEYAVYPWKNALLGMVMNMVMNAKKTHISKPRLNLNRKVR